MSGLDAPFRPRRGRVIPAVVGVVTLLGGIALAVGLPPRFQLVDRLLVVALAGAVAALMSRYATIHAEPRAEGLWIRNLGPGELLPWGEIESVRMAEGMPWPRLDLADGEDRAVMAIQRADGASLGPEVQRLADLVAARRRAS